MSPRREGAEDPDIAGITPGPQPSEGCGPGVMPAISGSSAPSRLGLMARSAFAAARRSSLCLRFSWRARSLARFSRVGLVRFATFGLLRRHVLYAKLSVE